MAMTLEQQKALAKAKARLRLNRGAAAAPVSAAGKDDREMSWGETVADAGKSLGVGVYRGAAGLVGLPHDLGNFLGGGLSYGVDRLRGYSPEEASARKQELDKIFEETSYTPGYADIIAATERVTGPLYQPKSVPGEYAETLGEFAVPGLGGKVNAGRKVAGIVIPALLSETAGQVTKGTEYEPWARVAGGLLGGAAALSGAGTAGTKTMLKNAPSADAVATQTKTAYKALDDARIVFDPNAYRSTAMKIQFDLRKSGLLPEQSGEVATQLRQIMARVGKLNGWTEIDSIRKNLGPIAAATKPELATEARRATIVIKHLDDLVDGGSVLSMNRAVPRNAIPEMVDKARELGRRNVIAKKIQSMTDKAQWYLGGEESGLRNTFASYGKASGKRLTDAEEKAFKSVVRREGVLNPAHLAGSRLGLLGSAVAGVGVGGFPGALLAPAVSFAARKGMEAYTNAAVNRALKTVLAGKDAQKAAASANRAGRLGGIQQGLLTGSSGRLGADGPPGRVWRDGHGQWWVTEDGRPYVPGRSRLVPYGGAETETAAGP